MKTRIENIALLDMRKATPESIAQIDRIDNVAMALVNAETKPLLAQLRINNLAMVVEMDEDVEIAMFNGEHTLENIQPDRLIFLMVNGVLSVSPALDPEMIRRGIRGGVINGVVRATGSQMAALSAAGVQVNGRGNVYPDDTRLRSGNAPLTEAEVRAMTHAPYMAKRVHIEGEALRALEEMGLPLYGEKGAVIADADAELFYRVWQGAGNIVRVPEGFTAMYGTQTVGRREALTLRGKRLIVGDLYLRADVTPQALSGLIGLSVTGRLFLPEALLETVLGMLEGEPELIPYEGELVIIDGTGTLGEDISLLPARVAIVASGVLAVSKGIPPEALAERVTLLHVDGLVRMTAAQQMALLPVLIIDGHVETGACEDDEHDALPDDVQLIENATSYVL